MTKHSEKQFSIRIDKKDKLVLSWPRVLGYGLWAFALSGYGFYNTIVQLARRTYYVDESFWNLLIPMLALVIGISMAFRLEQDLRMSRIKNDHDLNLDLGKARQALDSMGWKCRRSGENAIVYQPGKRSHWRWSRQQFIVVQEKQGLAFKSLSNFSISSGVFSTWVRNSQNERLFILALLGEKQIP